MREALVYARFLCKRFIEDRCLMVAGSLTFTTLLSLVPLLTLTVTLTSEIGLTKNLVEQVKVFLLKILVPDVAGRVVAVYMEQFARNTTKLTFFGLTFVLGSAIALMLTIDRAFNAIWRSRRSGHLLRRIAGYSLVLTVGPLFIGLGLSMTSLLVKVARRFERTLPLLDDWLLLSVPVVFTSLALVVAYRVIPRRHVPIAHAVVGALVAAIAFEIMKWMFVGYVKSFGTYSVVYGAFASVPIFLLWLFLCWSVVLLGAEVTATASYFNAQIGEDSRHVVGAKVCDALLQVPDGLELTAICRSTRLPINLVEDTLDELVQAKRVRVVGTRENRYALATSVTQDD